MNAFKNVIRGFSTGCACGRVHETSLKDVRIGSGLKDSTGNILRENNFPRSLLLVADTNTLRAAKGIEKSLIDFSVEYKIYDCLRVAEMRHVEEIEKIIKDRDIAVLSVGTGSLNDPCRLACARQHKLFAIFATAASMDGFASYSAPIVKDGFKKSYPAKSPEVIIGDTRVLAAAPTCLKSAGFSDMLAKFIGLADWRISALLTGEYYCGSVAALTENAVVSLMRKADNICSRDEDTAGKIFESLLKTGIAMSFAKSSRPASGSEHIIAHLIECKQLPLGIIPNFHGEDVGVCTLEMLKLYKSLAEKKTISANRENIDFDEVYRFYGNMAQEVKKLNTPTTVADEVEPEKLKNSWEKIRSILCSLPTYEECRLAMQRAGCKLSVEDIGKERGFFDDCVTYSPYMRRRITLLRLLNMIK